MDNILGSRTYITNRRSPPPRKIIKLVYCPIAGRVLPQMLRFGNQVTKNQAKNGKKLRKRERKKKKRQLSPSQLSPVAVASDANQPALWSRDIITPNAYLLHDKYVTGTQCLPSPSVLACQPILSCPHVSRGNETRCTWSATMSMTEGYVMEH